MLIPIDRSRPLLTPHDTGAQRAVLQPNSANWRRRSSARASRVCTVQGRVAFKPNTAGTVRSSAAARPRITHRRRGDIVVTSVDRQLVDPVTLLEVKTIGLLNQTGDDRAQVIAPGGKPDLFDGQPLAPLAFRAPRRAGDQLIGPVGAQQRLQPVDAVKNPLLADTPPGRRAGTGKGPDDGRPSRSEARDDGPATTASCSTSAHHTHPPAKPTAKCWPRCIGAGSPTLRGDRILVYRATSRGHGHRLSPVAVRS